MKIVELGEGDGIRTHKPRQEAAVLKTAVFASFTTPSPELYCGEAQKSGQTQLG